MKPRIIVQTFVGGQLRLTYTGWNIPHSTGFRNGALNTRRKNVKMKLSMAALSLIIMSAPAFAAPPASSQGSDNRSPVATATLDALEAGVNVGQTISDRNTNPDNTYYQDNGYTGRGDEVSTLAHTKQH
jgi:hypothetical protein